MASICSPWLFDRVSRIGRGAIKSCLKVQFPTLIYRELSSASGVVPNGGPCVRANAVNREDEVTPDQSHLGALGSSRHTVDREWFERTVVELLPDLFGTALRLTRNRADAEDLVAETVARGWSHLHELDGPDAAARMAVSDSDECVPERPADRRPARRARIARRRDAARAFRCSSSSTRRSCCGGGRRSSSSWTSCSARISRARSDALPEPFRLVVVLADMHGCTYQEIAETLQVPIGTVRSRLARARALLQKALWTHAQDAGLVARKPRKATTDHD